MDFGLGSYLLSFAAGGLSTLSPCVLPLVPILLGTALTQHRWGPFALAAGLTLSFTVIGVFIASLGAALGIDQDLFRTVAAVVLVVFGVVLISARLQERLAGSTSGLSSLGQGLLTRLSVDGLAGQFLLGLLLGVVWSPCAGPTLGATVTLASQGKDLTQVTLMMALFGMGSSLPLIGMGLASRQVMTHLRNKMLAVGTAGKRALGIVMMALGVLILSGGDKSFETWILRYGPEWLVQAATAV